MIVLDSFGCGEAPDAAAFGDEGSNTLRSVASSPLFDMRTMLRMGYGRIPGVTFLPKEREPIASFGRMQERSAGKDTTIGHWEIAGVISPKPMPVFPNGFPEELLDEFSRRVGRGWLCNKPYSGTEVIKDYGEEQLRTGKLIVYTSGDSVFQIAAHEGLVPPDELYRICETARELLTGDYAVGRVIARPFVGTCAADFTRTGNRRDFSLLPPSETLLDEVKAAGLDVVSVGKIRDIFAGQGVTEVHLTHSNAEGMAVTMDLANKDFHGLCFVNLVDYDSMYGHRRDRDGYAEAVNVFDRWLPGFLERLGPEDALLITADHGCDPLFMKTTDHTREYVPLIVYGKNLRPTALGTRNSFADAAATVAELLGVEHRGAGTSFAGEISVYTPGEDEEKMLTKAAVKAAGLAYAPYSGFQVGAALLGEDGTVYTGCNVENAAHTPCTCAERTAIAKAVSSGCRKFKAIAVAGGKGGRISWPCPPCGVCRQALAEFADPAAFPVIMVGEEGNVTRTLASLLPMYFGPQNLLEEE